MLHTNLVIIAIIGFVAWYYYTKLQESEQSYLALHKQYNDTFNENLRLKERLNDLQTYKNDVSKTFQILDNELVMINEHLKKQTPHENTTTPGRISIMTPDLLSTLFTQPLNVTTQPLNVTSQPLNVTTQPLNVTTQQSNVTMPQLNVTSQQSNENALEQSCPPDDILQSLPNEYEKYAL